jgi:hypothetical protein
MTSIMGTENYNGSVTSLKDYSLLLPSYVCMYVSKQLPTGQNDSSKRLLFCSYVNLL